MFAAIGRFSVACYKRLKCKNLQKHRRNEFGLLFEKPGNFSTCMRVIPRENRYKTHTSTHNEERCVAISGTVYTNMIAVKSTTARKILICIPGDLHRENLTCTDVARRDGGGGYYQLATRARATCTSRWYSATPCNPHAGFASAVNS